MALVGSSPGGSCLLASDSSLYPVETKDPLSSDPEAGRGVWGGWAFLVQEVICVKVSRKETSIY